MNKNKEQIKNEEITEDEEEMVELGEITIDAAYELYTIVKDAIMELEEQYRAMDTNLWPLYRNLRKELF